MIERRYQVGDLVMHRATGRKRYVVDGFRYALRPVDGKGMEFPHAGAEEISPAPVGVGEWEIKHRPPYWDVVRGADFEGTLRTEAMAKFVVDHLNAMGAKGLPS